MPLGDIPVMIKAGLRALFTPYPMAPRQDMRGKNIIVTGASVGSIGYETAKTLAAWGANVVVTSRSKVDSMVESLHNDLQNEGRPAQITGHTLDTTDPISVQSFVSWYHQTFNGKLDILINNAGIFSDIMGKWKQPHLSKDGYEIHWRTNYLGPMHLTHLLLPLLKKTAAENAEARVVFVASVVHEKGSNQDMLQQTRPYNSWQAYGNSKLAVVHSAFEMQRRFGPDNIKTYVLHPGSIATNIAHKGLEGAKIFQTLLRMVSKLQMVLMLTPEQGAQTQIYCATQPHVKPGYYDRSEAGKHNPDADVYQISKSLWDNTEQWVKSLQNQTTESRSNTENA